MHSMGKNFFFQKRIEYMVKYSCFVLERVSYYQNQVHITRGQ